MIITIDTTQPLSPADVAALRAYVAGPAPATAEAVPVAKPKSKPAAAPETPAPPVVTPSPEPVVPDAEEPVHELRTAVSRATELVAAGKSSEVKAALATAGAKRVSELTPATLPVFLAALDN